MAQPIVEMRRTRFVVVSDTHNGTSKDSFKLPKGDVLIHAGDLTNQGSFKELEKAVRWIEDADFESKIVIAGNHDISLDSPFYSQYGLYFHNQDPQDIQKCQALLQDSKSILYLKHESATVRLSDPSGPRTTFKVFGSPYSPAKDMWAFGYPPEEADLIWGKIPLDSDIVLTHTPPKFHLDERCDRRSVGCEALRHKLWRVRPQLVLCGHVHESRGAEIVKWDLMDTNIKYKELDVYRWVDPGENNNKQSLLNLTQRSIRPLDNDGAAGNEVVQTHNDDEVRQRHPSMDVTFSGASLLAAPSIISTKSRSTIMKGLFRVTTDILDLPIASAQAATWGQGGVPPSRRCDLEALSGRLGRRETAIVNAAMMASSWPHEGAGGKKFNKPIVIDLDLPRYRE